MIEPSPDYSGGNIEAGSPVQPCHDDDDPTCTLTSETYATSPADRARLKLGVGEQVTLTYSPGSATWTLAGDGEISFEEGDDSMATITFTASDTAGSATITANGDNGSASLTFNIVEPTNIHFYKRSGIDLVHQKDTVSSGFEAYVYVHPNDVNFYRVRIREKDSLAVGTGCLVAPPGTWHGGYTIPDPMGGAPVDEWMSMVNHTSAYGSNTGRYDQIALYVPRRRASAAGSPYSNIPGHGTIDPSLSDRGSEIGRVSYTILWQWQVIGKSRLTYFPAVHQVSKVFQSGDCENSKTGDTRSSFYFEDTTCPDDLVDWLNGQVAGDH